MFISIRFLHPYALIAIDLGRGFDRHIDRLHQVIGRFLLDKLQRLGPIHVVKWLVALREASLIALLLVYLVGDALLGRLVALRDDERRLHAEAADLLMAVQVPRTSQ